MDAGSVPPLGRHFFWVVAGQAVPARRRLPGATRHSVDWVGQQGAEALLKIEKLVFLLVSVNLDDLNIVRNQSLTCGIPCRPRRKPLNGISGNPST